LREANNWGKTVFINCRYGNVLGSRASILELLLRLKQEDKPFTITDKRCTRFWLQMDDAIDLILLSLEQEYPGVTIVPKAAASPVMSLFKAVDSDREIIDVGIRPGEKIHEMLIDPVESLHTVDMGNYFIVYPPTSKIKSNLPDQYQYTSDNPAKTLSVDDLREIVNT
jgi:UDP-N-acetylglucosamine 4,6-dehydratase